MNTKEKTTKQKIKLILIGLIMIPIIFLILITILGAIITTIKDHTKFNLITYWKTAINNQYPWILSLLLSVLSYLYYTFKIFQTKDSKTGIKKSKKNDYGQAQWASEKELNKNYPLVNFNDNHEYHGFVVNANQNKHQLTFNIRSNTHSLVIGGTGSGKTQNLVLPTININSKSTSKPSMIITDPKGELYQEQKTLLIAQGYQVLALNLRDVTASSAWNPLAMIYQQFKTMLLSNNKQEQLQLKVAIQSDIQDLTKTLFTTKKQEDPFWTNSGALITEAIIMAMLEDAQIAIEKTNNDKMTTLAEVLPINKFNLASVAVISSMQKEMIAWLKNRDDTSLAKITASQVLHGESKTLSSVLMTMSTYLSIFKNDFIRNLTCNNDLNFDDFINRPTALFIIVPDENHNYYVFIALLISQLYKFLVGKANNSENSKLARPVYFLCDEFGNVPTIANLDAIITVARSRNIFFQLILQDLKQLTSKYGQEKANVIFTNCSLHIFLQTIDLETAERYSKMIGDTTVLQISTSGKGKEKNKSETLTGHRLILASDLMKLAPKQAIIFYARENPIKTKFVAWHQMKPNLPKDNEVKQELTLINFNQDYYYDIKLIAQKLSNTATKKGKRKSTIAADEDVNLDSKSSLEQGILNLKAMLAEYDDDGSSAYQNLKAAINKQIKFYQSTIKKLK